MLAAQQSLTTPPYPSRPPTLAGELPAFFVLGNTLLYQVLASAAVARSFSAFLAQLAGQPPDFFLVGGGGWDIDCMAFGIALLITLLVATGVRESALAITGVPAAPAVPAVSGVPAAPAVPASALAIGGPAHAIACCPADGRLRSSCPQCRLTLTRAAAAAAAAPVQPWWSSTC